MPARNYFFGILIAIASFVVLAPSAYADPHAVFYTDRAQEQLFFNVLAALNQADYVESGIDSGQYNRPKLVASRQSASSGSAGQPIVQFTGEQSQLISSTHTDLPGIVSRNITLEGDDLWTAYLVYQFALETSIRKSTSRLARILCQNVFGDPGCNQKPGNDNALNDAFTTIPISKEGEIAIAQDAILASGEDSEKQLKIEIQNATNKQDIGKNKALYTVPRPYDASLGLLRKNNPQTANEGASDFINNLTSEISGAAIGVDPTTFSNVTFDSDGSPKLADNITSDAYVLKLKQIMDLPYRLQIIADYGEEQARTFQYYQENPTAKADSLLKLTGDTTDGSGPLVGRITTPVSAKLASVDSALALANSVATSQQFASAADVTTPGTDSLVTPGLSNTLPPGVTDNLPDFSNIVLNTSNQQGQVAGVSQSFDTNQNQIFQETYNQSSTRSLSPAANPRDPLEEPGVIELINRATNMSSNAFGFYIENPSNASAFDLSMQSLLKTTSLGDIFCSIFPSVPGCTL